MNLNKKNIFIELQLLKIFIASALLLVVSGCSSSSIKDSRKNMIPEHKGVDYLSIVLDDKENDQQEIEKNEEGVYSLESLLGSSNGYSRQKIIDKVQNYQSNGSSLSSQISFPRYPVKLSEKTRLFDISLDVSASTSEKEIFQNLAILNNRIFIGKNSITPNDELLFRVYGYDSVKGKMVGETLSISLSQYKYDVVGRYNKRKDYFNAVLIPVNTCRKQKGTVVCTSISAIQQQVLDFYTPFITKERYHKFSYFLSHLETIHTNNRSSLKNYESYKYIFITDGAFNVNARSLIHESTFNPAVIENHRDNSLQYRPLQFETFKKDEHIFDMYYAFLQSLKGGRTMCAIDENQQLADSGSVEMIGVSYGGNSEYLKQIEDFYTAILFPCPIEIFFN